MIARFTILMMLMACGDHRSSPAPISVCKKFGDNCEVSPGKLGTCVTKDNCTQDCLVCQSQH